MHIRISFRKSGFTLVELLITLGIIGILSMIVLANLQQSQASGRDNKRIGDIKQIQLSLEQYASAHNGYYPPTIASLVPVYLPTNLVPPAGTSQGAYTYVPLTTTSGSANCTGYHLGAILENANSFSTADADATPSADGYVCAAAGVPTGTLDFYGSSPSCGTATAGSPDLCYDVRNIE
jgi:prepilin-type N-terminal cleavage/methylation domain-containing protein